MLIYDTEQNLIRVVNESSDNVGKNGCSHDTFILRSPLSSLRYHDLRSQNLRNLKCSVSLPLLLFSWKNNKSNIGDFNSTNQLRVDISEEGHPCKV
jgi:hypothetical protein